MWWKACLQTQVKELRGMMAGGGTSMTRSEKKSPGPSLSQRAISPWTGVRPSTIGQEERHSGPPRRGRAYCLRSMGFIMRREGRTFGDCTTLAVGWLAKTEEGWWAGTHKGKQRDKRWWLHLNRLLVCKLAQLCHAPGQQHLSRLLIILHD